MSPSLADVQALFELPFNDLIYRAQTVHRQHFDANAVQLSTLLSIKTGGCSEDCGYCSQSARFHTGVVSEPLMSIDEGCYSLARLNSLRRLALITTTTISTLRQRTTTTSFTRTVTIAACRRCSRCARQVSRSAVVASSAWANRAHIGQRWSQS